MPRDSAHLAVVDQNKNNLKKLETYITTGMDNATEIALDFVEHHKGKSGPYVEEMKKMMMEYVVMEQRLKDFVDSVDDVKKQAKEDKNEDTPLEELLDEALKKRQTEKPNPRQHDKYQDMLTKIEELSGADGGAEPAEPATDAPAQIDADLALTQADVVTKCPYTGKEMVNPVKNRLCGHNYEQEGIDKYIRQRKGKAKCPLPGCINEKALDLADLEENKELRRYIEAKNRQGRKGPKK